MRRHNTEPIQKHTLNLFEGDFEKLTSIVGPKVGAGRAIRYLVRNFIRKSEEKEAQRETLTHELDISLEEVL